MAKATLEFDLENPEDAAALKRTMSVDDLYLVLGQVANKLFRPARKHGYGENHHVQQCVNKAIDAKCEIEDFELDDYSDDVVTSAISKLESDFYALLEEYNIDIEDIV